MEIEIIRAQVEDVPQLVASAAALFAEDGGTRDPLMDISWPRREGGQYYTLAVQDRLTLCLVARAGDEHIGHLIGRLRPGDPLRPTAIVADLESMRVAEPYRGHGVGGRLVDEFLRWARDRGANRSAVTAYASNEGALRFYAARGFMPLQLHLEREL